jgi:flagellar hook-basal body complex protein FliE
MIPPATSALQKSGGAISAFGITNPTTVRTSNDLHYLSGRSGHSLPGVNTRQRKAAMKKQEMMRGRIWLPLHDVVAAERS